MDIRCRHSFFRFGLRTMLVVVLLFAAPMTWIGGKLEASRRQAKTVAALRALGVQWFEYDDPETTLPTGLKWLTKLTGPDAFRNVTSANCEYAWVDDAVMRQLES